MSTYKLRCSIVGHSSDVRAVTPAFRPNGGIISASRDRTAVVWNPNKDGVGFTQGDRLTGHSNFVVAICTLPPTADHPHGLVATGSNDKTILLFELGKLEPVFRLSGHADTVSCLASGKHGILLSGSWDTTAKVWLRQTCIATLQGHQCAIWAIVSVTGKGCILTGSADRSIMMWKDGKVERTFHGHEDCVRGLVVSDNNSFLSCANDATVRRWMLTGECLAVFYGHTSFVYGLALLPNGIDFVTCGEDRAMRVWEGGECIQTVTHPSQSVWSVAVLSNGDICTGSSDGVLRVFTCDISRMAGHEDCRAYDDLVASSIVPTQLGDINMDDLPGQEALTIPGLKDGQTKMVRFGNKVELYTWDTVHHRWNKTGDVVGASEADHQSTGKTTYEGKEYDHVLDVDIAEGQPPLRLPYNISQDPWMAAQTFLTNNNLNTAFLDQVATFIMKNCKGASRSVKQFDGDIDPFTGSARYKPAGSVNGGARIKNSHYFPITTYLSIDNVNSKQIIGKLLEFNKHVGTEHQIKESSIFCLESLLSGNATKAAALVVENALCWPTDKLFPILDILRAGVKDMVFASHFTQLDMFLPFLCSNLAPGSLHPNVLLALRTVVNLFSNSCGVAYLASNTNNIMPLVCHIHDGANRNTQFAQCTALLNFVVMATTKQDQGMKVECLTEIVKLLEMVNDSEAVFRLLVAIGTLTDGDDVCGGVLHSVDVTRQLQKMKASSDSEKVVDCLDALLTF